MFRNYSLENQQPYAQNNSLKRPNVSRYNSHLIINNEKNNNTLKSFVLGKLYKFIKSKK